MSESLLKKILLGDRGLWLILFVIFLVSVLELYSASSFFANKRDSYTFEIVSHSIALIFGFIFAIIIHHKWIKIKWINYAIHIFSLSSLFFLGLLFLHVTSTISIGGITLFGISTENDASRWITLFTIKFQPSEVAKIGLIGWLSILLSCKPENNFLIKIFARLIKKELTNEKFVNHTKFWMAWIITLIFAIFVGKENLSTGILMFCIGGILIFASGICLKQFFIGLGIIILFLFVLILGTQALSPDQKKHMGRLSTWENRIENFLNEDEKTKYEYNDKTAQVVHSQIAIARGGLVGVGPGNSIERDYLPQIYADFIFAIIVEELGFFLSLCIILLYLAICYRCFVLAKKSEDNSFYALLLGGIGCIIVIQAAMSIAVTVHIMPVTGQPLPFISRGRTSLILSFICIGIVQRIATDINEKRKKQTISEVEETDQSVSELQA